jgi:hypothetical protein
VFEYVIVDSSIAPAAATRAPDTTSPLVFTDDWLPTSCNVHPTEPSLYLCSVQLSITGGVPPYEIQVGTTTTTCSSLPCYVEFSGPRCAGVPWGATVVDAAGQTATEDFWFDPDGAYAGAFPGGSCP